MGNAGYNIIEEKDEENLPPIVYSGHPKGKAYGIMLDRKLKSSLEWAYFPIYDLRNGQMTWKLNSKVYGNELELRNFSDSKRNFFLSASMEFQV